MIDTTARNLSVAALAALVTLSVAGLATPAAPPPPVSCGDLVTSGWCDDELAALCYATEAAKSPPLKQRDIDGLVGKVVTASLKLSQSKFGDADDKLTDYETKLDALVDARKIKIDEGDADVLAALLVDAQVCVAAIP